MNITVVPALPGFRTIHDFDGKLEALEPIIAWRVESTPDRHGQHSSIVIALTPDGEADGSVGVQNPDGSVSFGGSYFESLEFAQIARAAG